MKLGKLLAGLTGLDLANFSTNHPSLELEVTGISTNSQTCEPGYLFLGIPGSRVDGGEFWQGAMRQGAIAAVITPEALAKVPAQGEAIFTTPDLILTSSEVASKFYGYPARTLKLIGITGTNGKTTTTHLIEFFLQKAQQPTALLGTLYTRWQNHQETAINTTPLAVDLQ